MHLRLRLLVVTVFLAALVGCGSSLKPGFSLQVTPNTVSVQNLGAPQALTVALQASNGFTGTATVTLSGLPSGVTASPASVTVSSGQTGQFLLSATNARVGTPATVAVAGSAGGLSATGSASISVTEALSTVSLSGTSFDFGDDLLGNTLTKTAVTVMNTGTTDISLAPTLSGDPSYSLVAAQSCGTTLASGASCPMVVAYAPTVSSGATPQTASLNLGLGNVATGTAQIVALTGLSAALPAGAVSPTANPLVAQYTVTLPFPGTAEVNFGAGTSYGRETSSQTATVAGQTLTFLVAGMPQNSTYHLQAEVQLASGVSMSDTDHTFTNGSSILQPQLTVTTTAGATPQPGVEELTFVDGANGVSTLGLVVTDLQGNVIWSYGSNSGTAYIQGAKLLPNGHFLLRIGNLSEAPLAASVPDPSIVQIREIDLAGNVARSLTMQQLNQAMQDAGYNIPLEEFHHDVTPLPNGHWLLLSNTFKPFTDLPGYRGVTNVLGDVLIDVDENGKPVWVWNSFDHLDVNRQPYMFPDWTHSNAVVYSPSDHDLILSMRHQNWVLKLDYQDGAGTGNILWHLGEGGDFKLVNGTDPTDWNYAQHFPSLFSQNSSGVFSLGLMDNGNDRAFPAGVTCGATGAPACLYTTIPVFQLDESAMTATLTFHQILDPSLFSYFGGNTELMANGDIEYDLAGSSATDSDIFEVTPTSTPQTLWHMHSTNSHAYRGYRIPSLYPGVQW